MASPTEYSFKAKIASRGYHVFKETTWNNFKEEDSVRVDLETNKLSKNVDLCEKSIFQLVENGGTYPERNFLSFLLFYQGRKWFCKWFSNIVHHLFHLMDWKFCPEQQTFEKMKNFVDSLYDYDYSGVNDEESSDEEEAAIVIETDHSKPVSQMPADSKLVSYTDSSS